MGNWFVPIAMFGWIPVVIGLFACLKPRHAILVGFLFAWLFLPMAGYKIPGFTAYTKMTAATVGVLIGAMIFDLNHVIKFRPHWVDIPMVVWCICPMASSLTNGLGAYDGASAIAYQMMTWGFPYFIGRLYFCDSEGWRELAIGIFAGGLIYVPLCLWEIRMSPQLHLWVYGYYQHSFAQTIRFGGFRPMVFMQHGLMVGMWMAMASLLGVWLWWTGLLKSIWGIGIGWWVSLLLLTTVLCKSTGALVLLAAGLAVLALCRWGKTRIPLYGLILMAPLYMTARASGIWSGEWLVDQATTWVGSDRADSLKTRIDNENALAAKALERPLFGWGGWGRARIYNDEGRDISITDGLWIIALGDNGLVGLGSLTLALLLPALLIAYRWPVLMWTMPDKAAAIGLGVIVALYMIDCIPNGMVNPIFMLAAGGVVGFGSYPRLAAVTQSNSWLVGRKSNPVRVP